MRIRCTHAAKPHLHATLGELAFCVQRFRTYASPRQVEQLVALGCDGFTAANLTRAEADELIVWAIECRNQGARGAVSANGQWSTLPF